jgi:hypothetical protein
VTLGEPGMIPADLPDLVVKVYNLCRVKTIRIVVSAVMDGWEGMIPTLKSFCFTNVFKEKIFERYREGTGKCQWDWRKCT